jgi:hypothetical protein
MASMIAVVIVQNWEGEEERHAHFPVRFCHQCSSVMEGSIESPGAVPQGLVV